MPTIGVPSAAAMCVGPVSPDTINAAPRASATRSAIVVFGDTIAAPSAPAATAAASDSSHGPHSTTDLNPCLARSSAAIAASRSGGQRLFGHAAPGFKSAYGPPAS